MSDARCGVESDAARRREDEEEEAPLMQSGSRELRRRSEGGQAVYLEQEGVDGVGVGGEQERGTYSQDMRALR